MLSLFFASSGDFPQLSNGNTFPFKRSGLSPRFCQCHDGSRDPTFGEFVPRLGISATFGEKFGELRYLGDLQGNCILWDELGTVSVVTHFHQISHSNQIVMETSIQDSYNICLSLVFVSELV